MAGISCCATGAVSVAGGIQVTRVIAGGQAQLLGFIADMALHDPFFSAMDVAHQPI